MSNKYEITGTIQILGDTQSFGAKGFTKREFVVEEIEGKYPQLIKFEAVKDGCDKLDAFRVGDTATVSFNIRGSEYKGKHYVNLQAWKIERDGQQQKQESPRQDAHNTAKANAYQTQPNDNVEDDIPF